MDFGLFSVYGFGIIFSFWIGIIFSLCIWDYFLRVSERFDKTIVSAWKIAVSMILCNG